MRNVKQATYIKIANMFFPNEVSKSFSWILERRILTMELKIELSLIFQSLRFIILHHLGIFLIKPKVRQAQCKE